MNDSDETFLVSLGGREWEVPHLPFRLVKKIQPALFEVYQQAGGSDMSPESISKLSEKQLDRLAEATWNAIAFVDKELTFEQFLDITFSVGDLIQAFPSVARASGLTPSAGHKSHGDKKEGK